jgi:di/tricarboxylate transporter
MEWLRPAVSFFLVVLMLLITGLLDPKEALSGFANEQLAIIVLLLIISSVFKKSTAVNSLFAKMLKPTDSPRMFLFKMMGSVGISSAFFNNTPLVAMLMPYVYSWSKKNKISPSKFLIPLSFSSILGGCITVIGTSTILIASGMAESLGEQPLSLFDVTPVGLPLFVVGVLFLGILGYVLLPSRGTDGEKSNAKSRQFFFETEVSESSPIIGKTVTDAGLRNMEGMYLVEIKRGDREIRPVSSNEVVRRGEQLFFAGDQDSIENLNKLELGLSIPQSSGIQSSSNNYAELVLSHRSQLRNRQIRETDLRSRFDAAVVAIHRNGERVWGQLGRVKLKEGDVLLVAKGKDFTQRVAASNDFYVISNDEEDKEDNVGKVLMIFFGMIAAVVLTAVFQVALIKSLLLLLAVSLLVGLAKPKDIKNSIDYNLILVIALGLAVGHAMKNSGADLMLAEAMNYLSSGYGPVGGLIVVFIITSLLSAIITPSPAIAVVLSVAINVAHINNVPTEPFIICVALAAAANFITPIGYQTNMMVYGPGRYRFIDYFKVGLPLTIIYLVGTVLILSNLYDL